MRNKSLIFTSTIFVIFVLGGTLIFLFWRLGILEKEFTSSPKVQELQTSMQYIQNFPFNTLNQVFQNLPLGKIQIPTVTPEELGKESIF